jgi:hypothetical protein
MEIIKMSKCPFCSEEADKFNEGFLAARDGEPERPIATEEESNAWMEGYAYGSYEPMTQRIADLEKENKRLVSCAIDVLLASSNNILQILDDAVEIQELKAKFYRHKHVAKIKNWNIKDSVLTVDWEIEHA